LENEGEEVKEGGS